MSQVNIFDNVELWFFNPMMNLSSDITQHYHYQNMLAGAIDIVSNEEVIKAIEKDFSDKDHLLDISNKAKIERGSNYENIVRDGVIILFSKLEAGVKDIIKNIFIHAPTMFNDDSIKGMKISYAEYRKFTQDELSDLFLIDYERTFLKEKYGFERFESMLKPVGLAGETEFNPEHKKALIELSMVRNLLVHKNGIIDRQFLNICGYLHLEVGSKIKVDIAMNNKYIHAVNAYLLELANRMKKLGELYKEYLDLLTQEHSAET